MKLSLSCIDSDNSYNIKMYKWLTFITGKIIVFKLVKTKGDSNPNDKYVLSVRTL